LISVLSDDQKFLLLKHTSRKKKVLNFDRAGQEKTRLLNGRKIRSMAGGAATPV
jgi:hypothetical protein